MFINQFFKILEPKKNFFKFKLKPAMEKMTSFVVQRNSFDCACKNSFPKVLCNKRLKLVKNLDVRDIHSANVRKNFLANESIYAHDLLKNSGIYSDSEAFELATEESLNIENEQFLMKKNWSIMSKVEVLESFEYLSFLAQKNNLYINSPKYQIILQILSNNCSSFDNKELYHLLHCLRLWHYKNSEESYEGFWKILDNECCKRIPNFSIDEIFLINYHLFKLNMMRLSNFTKYTLENLNVKQLTVENLMQFAFMMKVYKRVSVNLFDFEYSLEKNFDKLSVDKLGIIAMAFFKYKAPVHNEQLLLKIIKKLQVEITTVADISLASILKLLRKSFALKHIYQFDILLNLLIPEVPKRSLQTITHIAHMQGVILLQNDKLLSSILSRYKYDIKKARLKDIERILFSLYIFNHNPENTPFYCSALDELLDPTRTKEINRHINSFVYSIMYMIQMNFYPEKALHMIMAPEFIKKLSLDNINNIERDYLVIDYCLEIEHPEYKGPRLKKSIRNYLLKKFGVLSEQPLPKSRTINQANKLLIDIAHVCKQIFNSESVAIDSLLPYIIKTDVILSFDPQTKGFVSPAEKLYSIPRGEIKFAPKDGRKWYVLVVGSHNILSRNTKCATGILAMHLRHLEKIGYIPILIPHTEWQNLISEEEKTCYIKKLLLIN